jgi:DNA repair exonuclease SbcCD ATPase subunit
VIRFTKIFWKNLLSTGNSGIEIALDQHKTTILFGPSGSGKSTLLDALTFCLFNKPFRNINKPKLVNAVNEGDCVVFVEFETNGKKYKITRGIKPNIFEITENGILLNQDSSNVDYQSVLENQILKINYRTFLQVVMLGAANFTPFMQLKPSDRRNIIEDLLDIQIFSVMNSLLREKVSLLRVKLHDLDGSISHTNQKIDMASKYVNTLRQRKTEKIEQINEMIETEKRSLESILSYISELETKKSEMSIKTLKPIESQLFKCNDIKSKLMNNKSRLSREIEFYSQNETCPTCKQSIAEDTKICEVHKKTSALEEVEIGLSQTEAMIEKLIMEKTSILDVQSDIQKIDFEIREKNTAVSFHKTNIKRYKEEINEMNRSDTELQEQLNELNNLNSELKSLLSQKESHLYEQQLIEYSSLILKDNGVKSKIIEQYVPYINQYVNMFLNSMSFYVNFKLDENFEEQIKSKGRDFFSYENFSEGERQRLDLALLFTWRCIAKSKNSVNTNLLIMDEVFDSYLDTAATENVLSIFKEEIFDDTNIFVISHKESIVDKFDKTVKYRVDKGFSKTEP